MKTQSRLRRGLRECWEVGFAILQHISAPLRLLKTLSDSSDEKCDRGIRIVRRGRRRGVGGACSLSAISGQCPSVDRCYAISAGPKWQKANKLRPVYWPASRGRASAVFRLLLRIEEPCVSCRLLQITERARPREAGQQTGRSLFAFCHFGPALIA